MASDPYDRSVHTRGWRRIFSLLLSTADDGDGGSATEHRILVNGRLSGDDTDLFMHKIACDDCNTEAIMREREEMDEELRIFGLAVR